MPEPADGLSVAGLLGAGAAEGAGEVEDSGLDSTSPLSTPNSSTVSFDVASGADEALPLCRSRASGSRRVVTDGDPLPLLAADRLAPDPAEVPASPADPEPGRIGGTGRTSAAA